MNLTPLSARINSRAWLIIAHATRLRTREGCVKAREALARLVGALDCPKLTSYYLGIFDKACPLRSLPRRYASYNAYEEAL